MNPKGASRHRAQIEMLESRCLLSAGPVSVADAMHVGAAALHTHPTRPNLLGIYNGSNGVSAGSGDLEFDFTSERTTGKLSGLALLPARYVLSGSISVKGKFSLHGFLPTATLTVTGTASADGTTLTGSFAIKLKHNRYSFRGTYVASLSSRT